MAIEPSASPDEQAINFVLRTCRIIAFALVAGVVGFLGMCVLVLRSGEVRDARPWDIGSPISLAAVAYAAAAFIMHVFVPALIVNSQRRKMARGERPTIVPSGRSPLPDTTIGGLLRVYQTSFILGSALLEGAAFFAAIAYFLEGKAPTLIVAGVLVLALLARFPTRSGLESWLVRQQELMENDRLMGE